MVDRETELGKLSEADVKVDDLQYSPLLEPAIHPLPFYDRESMRAIWSVCDGICIEIEGVSPTARKMYEIPSDSKIVPIMTLTYEVDRLLTDEEIAKLNAIVISSYSSANEIRKIDAVSTLVHKPMYLPVMPNYSTRKTDDNAAYLGHLAGPNVSNKDINALTQGLYVMRKFPPKISRAIRTDSEFGDFLTYPGKITDLKGEPIKIPKKTMLELRDSGLSQVAFIELATSISAILAGKEVPQDIYAQIYDRLMKLKLKSSPQELPGTEGTQDEIMRRLLLPVAHPEVALQYGVRPQNLLLVGVPGTGKTEMAKKTLRDGAQMGVVVLFLSAEDYTGALLGTNNTLKTVDGIKKTTGRNVILVVDDIEEVGGDNEKIRTTMMNHLAGAVEQNYYLLATTNYPEKMTSQVMNPERLFPIYCALPNVDARELILRTYVPTHLNNELNTDFPLFNSEDDIERIVKQIAEGTEGLDSRNLRAICTEASARLYQRVMTSNKIPQFTEDDWIDAYKTVMYKHDHASTKRRCEELLAMVEKGRKKQTKTEASTND